MGRQREGADSKDLAGQRRFWREFPRRRPEEIAVPEPGQESVWDYPRPPRIVACPHEVRVEFAGSTVARSSAALRVLETSSPPAFYLPPDAVIEGVLLGTSRTAFCEWKGLAHLLDLSVDGRQANQAAWTYPAPDPAFAALSGYVAFHAGRVDACFVAEERVTPQPGDYYGGWVTSEIVGPFKGEAGTEDW